MAEYLEPKGLGGLQLAFDQLKRRLSDEGLFDEEHKRPLPWLPGCIAVVTSPSGAVIRDIMTVVYRRYPNVVLEIAPVRVQGEGADWEIAKAIQMLNVREDADVIILARGGGSLEDLQAFNSEIVARAIFASKIPVVSAVGHETDVTIADFTADRRAATPSAAAEIVVPVKEELEGRIAGMRSVLGVAMMQQVDLLNEKTVYLSRRLMDPRRRIADCRLRLDEAYERVCRGLLRKVTATGEQYRAVRGRLLRSSPVSALQESRLLLKHYNENLQDRMRSGLQNRAFLLRTFAGKLSALNPLAILERGYSITRTVPGYAVVRDVRQVAVGEEVEVTLSEGALGCRIERKKEDGQTDL